MRKIKPYPLKVRLLQILKIHSCGDVDGLVGAVVDYYSKWTVKKEVKRMEDEELIYSTRDNNNRKVYFLTTKGKELLKNYDDNFSGLSEIQYNIICLKWSNYVGGKRVLEDLPYTINALSINDKGEPSALLIEDEGSSSQALLDRINDAVKGELKLKKLYVILFNEYKAGFIPENIGGVEIEVFEYD